MKWLTEWLKPNGKLLAGIGTVENRDNFGLKMVFEEKNSTIDVIAVHGMGGPCEKSWIADNGIFWLHDLLPTTLPGVRIFSYGYHVEAHAQRSIHNSRQLIDDHALDLLNALVTERRNTKTSQRPIIFVTHCLGGIIVKQVLISSNAAIPACFREHESIKLSTVGVVFLGTPQRSINGASLAELVINMGSTYLNKNAPILGNLFEDSEWLQQQCDQYLPICGDFDNICFYETVPTPIGWGRQKLIVPRYSTVFPEAVNAKYIGTSCNHIQMVQFPSLTDDEYKKLSHTLCLMVKGASKKISENWENWNAVNNLNKTQVSTTDGMHAAQQLIQLATWLSAPDDFEQDHATFCAQRFHGTCNWIFERESYKSWIKSPESALLWLHARPGAGKSVLAAYIIEGFRSSAEVCVYFYFRFNNDKLRYSQSLLRSLAFQLAQKCPAIRDKLVLLCLQGMEVQTRSTGYIWQKIFKDTILQTKAGSCWVWIVDGLDECAPAERSLFMRLLAQIEGSQTPVKILIVSRWEKDIADIATQLRNRIRVDEITPDTNKEDMRRFVEDRLQASVMQDHAELCSETIEAICTESNGVFLWASRVLDMIEEENSQEGINTILESLPKGLDDLYLRIATKMSNMGAGQVSLARSIIIWTATALRPLTVSELTAALSSQFGNIVDLGLTIRHLCGGLVTVSEQAQIRFLHMTVRDFFCNSEYARETYYFSIALLDANLQVTKRLLESLSPIREPQARSMADQFGTSAMLPLSAYAASYWTYHLASSSGVVEQQILKFLDSENMLEWIELLAHLERLDVLREAAKHLQGWLVQRTMRNSSEPGGFKVVEMSISGLLCLAAALGYTEDVYEGATKDGAKHGFGTCTYANGEKYTGEWVQDLKSGHGVCWYTNGTCYDGAWRNDRWCGQGRFSDDRRGYVSVGEWGDNLKMNGWGRREWGDGRVYEGYWKDDQWHGRGCYISIQGDRYDGEFKEGRKHGAGLAVFADGSRFEGNWVHSKPVGPVQTAEPVHIKWKKDSLTGLQNTIEEDTGNHSSYESAIMTYSTGLVYEGGMKGGKKHGHGISSYPNGSWQEASYVEGIEHGYLIQSGGNGYHFIGEVKEGLRNGYGIEIGGGFNREYDGYWKNGLFHGKGSSISRQGWTFIGEFKEGYPYGRAVRAYKNGSRYDGAIDAKTSTMHGEGKMIYESGLEYGGMWKFDWKDGYGQLVFPTGTRFEGHWGRDIAKRGSLRLVRSPRAGLGYALFSEERRWTELHGSSLIATLTQAPQTFVAEHAPAHAPIMECGLPPTHQIFERQETAPFETIRHLGHGTYGMVDEARSITTGKVFARKIIRLQAITKYKILPSVEKEVEVMKYLNHQHIVKIAGTYQDPRSYAIVMSPVGEGDLGDFLEQVGVNGFPEEHCDWIDKWFSCLTSAVAYIHEQGIRHKDIKPKNIVQKGNQIYLTDFGSCHQFIADMASSSDGYAFGFTRLYCAPEVIAQSRRGRSADIFSLGCVFSEMITVLDKRRVEDYYKFRVTPDEDSCNGETHAYWKTLHKVAEWFSRTSRPRFWKIVQGMLEENPEARPSAAVFMDGLLQRLKSFCSEKHPQLTCSCQEAWLQRLSI
ncbi:hypothetical protein NA56DRAFT_610010 [Hyaloscypha hepaticicola]|uniref:Protein kinase domain-containing protein n=1 Tax=Hyaloscypha hepaticicola TaxID=2082293 RepID=A0A2J6PKN0_9HELO|nr:hypothetical protein NA56DRAFT_610010 [Hyaloscypha hepaticicola]